MKTVLTKVITMTALLVTYTQISYANSNLDIVVCLVGKGAAIEKAVYFSKTQQLDAQHLIDYKKLGKIYRLRVSEENTQNFNGLAAVQLEVWSSPSTPDVLNTDNIRFQGTATYTGSTGRPVVRIQNPKNQLTIQCEEQSSQDLKKAYSSIEVVLVP